MKPALVGSYFESVNDRALRSPGIGIQALNVHGLVSGWRTDTLCGAALWRGG